MEALRWNAKYAVLGIIAAVCMSAHMILMLLDRAAMKLSEAWSASAKPSEWAMITLFWLAPLWLGYAALSAGSPARRWSCFAGAAALTLLNLWHFFICAVPLLPGGPYTAPTAQHVLLVGSSAVASALMAWQAWRRPGPEA